MLIGSRFSLAFTAQVVLSALATAWGQGALGYDRAAVNAGQWWRLLSAGYVHTNGAHWALNIAGLAFLLALVPGKHRLTAVAALPVLSLAVFCAEHVLLSHAWGCGLSGPLHGLAVALLATARYHWAGPVVAVAAVAKVAHERWAGGDPGTEALIGAPVLVGHHATGVALGLLLGVGWAFYRLYGPQAVPRNL